MAALWWFCVLLIPVHFSLSYMQHNGMFLNMRDYAAGTSMAPYQQRILMAWFIRAVGHTHRFDSFALKYCVSLRYTAGFCTFIASVVSMIGAVLCAAGSIRVFTGNLPFSRWAGLLICYMAYFPLCLVFAMNFLLPYDVPSLFFLTFCLFCTVKDRPWLYLVAFAVGTTNRETICMAAPFFVAWYLLRRVRSRRFLVLHAAAQVALWVAIRAWIYRHNPGVGSDLEPVLTRVVYNVHILRNPLQWFKLLSNFGFLWIVLLVWRKYIVDPFLLAGLGITGLWLVILFGTGVYDEVRIFTDLASFVSVAVAVTIWNRFDAFRRSTAADSVRGRYASLNQPA